MPSLHSSARRCCARRHAQRRETTARYHVLGTARRYVGDIVVSVNPFKNVGCVGKSIRNRYKKGGVRVPQRAGEDG